MNAHMSFEREFTANAQREWEMGFQIAAQESAHNDYLQQMAHNNEINQISDHIIQQLTRNHPYFP